KNSSTFFNMPVLGGLRVRLGQWAFVTGEAGLFPNHPKRGFDAALGVTLPGGYRISNSLGMGVGPEMGAAGHALDSIPLHGGPGAGFDRADRRPWLQLQLERLSLRRSARSALLGGGRVPGSSSASASKLGIPSAATIQAAAYAPAEELPVPLPRLR